MKHPLLLILLLCTSYFAQAQFSPQTNSGFDFYLTAEQFDLADVDGDNDLDIIISGQQYPSLEYRVDLYRNDGTGFFIKDTNASQTLVNIEGGSIVFADIDGDLDQDVLISGETSTGLLKITLYRNDGTGAFTIDTVQSANLIAVDRSTIKFADIDGDTDLDLAIMGYNTTSGTISKIYTNDGLGNFIEDTANSAVISDLSDGDLEFADVDGDTDLDLLILGSNSVGGRTFLYLNDGVGNFSEDTVASNTIEDYDFGASCFVDIDGDTDLDLIVGGLEDQFGGDITMYTNNGSGLFTEVSNPFLDYIIEGDISVSDFDLDGDLDVFTTGYLFPTTTAHRGRLYKNDGSGDFTFHAVDPNEITSGSKSRVIFADLNNDGKEELIFSINGVGIGYYTNTSIQPISEINIKGNNVEIISGDTTPNITDGTDFEVVCNGASKSNTFTIENTGGLNLEVTSIVLSGINQAEYVIEGITLPVTLNASTSTTFDVIFTPTTPGVRLATVTVHNNDSDESLYTFDITGQELAEIIVSGTTGTYACAGGNDIINTSSSEIGLEYFLRNDVDDSIVDGPILGTGSGLTFDTGYLTEDTTFNIFSSPISVVTNGLKFDGTNESVEIPNHASLNPTNAITLESWVTFDTFGDRKPVIYKSPTNANGEPYYQYEFEIRDNGEVYFALSVNGSRKTLRTTGTSLAIDAWSHVACTWDGTTMRIYINGVAYANTTSAPGTLTAYTTTVRLGSHANATYGEMELDDVRIWSVARTATEILNAKDAELNGNETGLVAYYKLNENTGTTATDSSTNSNAGTLLNMETEDWIPGVISIGGSSSGFCELGELTEKVTITEACDILVSPKVMLQGAALNPTTGEEDLMRDDLRVNGLLPTTSPYSDNKMCDANVFFVVGNNAIVDWVWVELRDATDATIVVDGQSALLQRNGDVVYIDGTSPLTFSVTTGNYYIVIKHRNHLGIMTLNTFALSSVTTSVDFTNANNQITHGSNAQTPFGMQSDVVGMWTGNADGNTLIQYSGTNPDAPSILSKVLNDAGNFLNFPTYVVTGYNTDDSNMDGNTQYTGTTPDTPFIIQNVLAHPGNFLNFSTYQIIEQLPEN